MNRLLLDFDYKKGDLQDFKSILASININCLENNAGFALYLAINNNRVDIVEELILKHVNINTQYHIFAMMMGHKTLNYNNPINYKTCNQEIPLLMAVWNNNVEIVKLLLKYGANPNLIDNRENCSALSLAIDNRNYEIAKLLIKNNADTCCINDENESAVLFSLKRAADHNNRNKNLDFYYNFIKLLDEDLTYRDDLNNPDKNGYTLLDYAHETNDQRIINYLISKGAYESNDELPPEKYNFKLAKEKILTACKLGHKKILEKTIKHFKHIRNLFDEDLKTPLILAIENRYFDIAHILINSGKINLNEYAEGYSHNYDDMMCEYPAVPPIVFAVETGNYKLVKSLIDHGVKPVQKIELRDGWAGNTYVKDILISACLLPSKIDLRIFKLLLEKGCDASQFVKCFDAEIDKNPLIALNRTFDWTKMGSEKTWIELYSLLFNYGASLTPPYIKEKDISLYCAYKRNYKKLFNFLLNHGADVNGRCGGYLSPSLLYMVLSKGDFETAEVLIKHGATPNFYEYGSSNSYWERGFPKKIHNSVIDFLKKHNIDYPF